MPTDSLEDVPAWVLAFLAGRTTAEVQAWWAAVRKLYGPEGVRVDFRTMVGTASGPIGPRRLAAS